ncbi:hypothetical protein BC940DRAFT_171681 [Gongronella butleri]|nr:hypothetical protein BC940DRAFT_171681 [Gongronella butleri]
MVKRKKYKFSQKRHLLPCGRNSQTPNSHLHQVLMRVGAANFGKPIMKPWSTFYVKSSAACLRIQCLPSQSAKKIHGAVGNLFPPSHLVPTWGHSRKFIEKYIKNYFGSEFFNAYLRITPTDRRKNLKTWFSTWSVHACFKFGVIWTTSSGTFSIEKEASQCQILDLKMVFTYD